MIMPQPHFLLFCDTHLAESQSGADEAAHRGYSAPGRWHFVLERLDGPERLEVADSECAVNRERLALLSVVRGLEALEQPSRVTLVTTSRYVSRGLRYGLSSWREHDYKWERFGERRPVRNADLWRRVDVAMGYHAINCRLIQSASARQPYHPMSEKAVSEKVASGRAELPCKAAVATTCFEQTPANTLQAKLPGRAASFANGSFGQSAGVNRRFAAANPPECKSLSSSLDTSLQKARLMRLAGASRWWNLALAWTKRWRGRFQGRPAFYGA